MGPLTTHVDIVVGGVVIRVGSGLDAEPLRWVVGASMAFTLTRAVKYCLTML